MLRKKRAILYSLGVFLLIICNLSSASAQSPTAAFGVDDSIVCVGNTITFTDLSTPGGAAITNWDWDFGDFTTSTQQNPTHSYAAGGNYIVNLIVTDALLNKDTITDTIYVLLAQAVQNNIRICSPQSTTTIIANDPQIPGVTGTWFTASGAVIANPGNDTTLVSNLISGTYLFFWVVSDGTCSDADQVTVRVDQPVTTNAGPDQSLCTSPGTATMAAVSPAPGTGLWTTSSSATITVPSSRNTTITGLTSPGTYIFVWTTTNGSCVASDTMNIVVSAPITANAGSDQTACSLNPTATLAGNPASPGTGLWTTTGTAGITTPVNAGTGVTALANGTNTFIWTITNGGCIRRDTMLIVVSAFVTSNAGSDIQVCTSSGTTSLSGSSPAPGGGLWTALNGGSITTPSSATSGITGLTTAGTYNFVWTVTNGGCNSRDTVAVIVRAPITTNAGIDQAQCNTSTASITGSVASPGTSLWTTIGTSTIATPLTANTNISNLAIGNNTFIYTITYGACVTRDTIIVRRDSLKISNAGPDQSICLSSPTATLAGNNPSPGTGLWTKLNGGTITTPSSATTTITALTAGTHLFVWTITNGTCVSRDTMRIIVNTQAPANAGLDDEICQGSISFLSANDPSPAIGAWTTPGTAVIADPNDPNTSVSGFTTAGTYSFIWTVTNGACILRDTARIVVDSIIVANAGSDQVQCNTSTATLSGNSAAPGTGTWTSLGTALVTTPASANSGVTALHYGDNSFVWTIDNGICSSADTVVIRRDSIVTANAGPDKAICSTAGSTALAGNSATPGTGIWTALGGGIITAPSNPTSTVTGLSVAGTYTFVWSITNGTCISRDTVILTVSQNIIANAGSDQNICGATSATLAGNASAPGTGLWTTSSSATITTPGSPTSGVSGLNAGNYNFIWTITNGSCFTRDTIRIHIDSLIVAGAGIDLQICAGTTALMNGNTPSTGAGLWTALNGGTITSATLPTTTITGLNTAGNFDFVWTITNGTCVSRDTMRIVVDQLVIANAGSDQTICNANAATLAGNNPLPGSGLWSTTSAATITAPANPSSTITGLNAGSYQLIWTVTNNTCITSDTVNINIDSLEVSDAGPDQQICSGSAVIMAANPSTVGTGIWTALNGGTIADSSDAGTLVSGFAAAGDYDFVWTITNGSCISADTVTIEVLQTIQADAGTDQTLCAASVVTLAGNDPTPGTGFWSSVNPVLITDPIDSATTLTGLAAGTYEMVWTVTNNICITTDTVIVTIDSLVQANAGTDQEVCAGSIIVMDATAVTLGTAWWSTVTSGLIADSTDNLTDVSGLALAGNYDFVWTVANGSCISRDTMIIITDSLIVANAGPDQLICETFNATLAANDVTPGSGVWSTSGTAIITDPLDSNTTVTGLQYGSNIFMWTVTNNLCTSVDSVNIQVDSVFAALAGTDQEVCSGTVVSMNANVPLVGTGYWTALNGGIFTDSTSNITDISGLVSAGTHDFVWTITNGACASTDTVTILIDSLIIANAGIDQSQCELFTGTLAGNDVSPGTGLWTTNGTAIIDFPADSASTISGLLYGPNLFIWTVTNNFCTSVDSVVITVDSILPSFAGTDQEICASTATTFLFANDPSPGTGAWTTNSLALIDSAGNISTTVSGMTAAGDYDFVWTVTNGACISNDTIIVTVDSNVVADAVTDQQFCESQSSTTLTALNPAPGTGIWTTSSLAVIADSSDANTLISNLTAGSYEFVWTVTNGTCTTSDTIIVDVSVQVTAADAGADTQYCASAATALLINANTPLVGIGTWTTNTSAIIGDSSLASTGVSNLAVGQNLFIWTIVNGTCISSDTTIITINPNPVVDAGLDQFTTSGTPVILGGSPTANSGTGSYQYAWEPLAFLNDSTIANPTATVNVTQAFSLVVTDSVGCDGTDTVIVYINNPPVVNTDSLTINEDSTVVIIALANDTDPDNNINTGSVQIISGAFNGTASVDTLTGSIVYIPNANYFGADSIQYAVCDSGMPVYCDTAWIQINILPVNDSPVAMDDTISTPEDSCVQITILANDTDIENALVFSSIGILTYPSNGIATVDTLTGTITYCPANGFSGTDTLTYIICDAGMPVLCDTALVIITVIPNNDAPVAVNDTAFICSADTAFVNILANDTDAENGILSATIITVPLNGTAVLDTAYQIIYLATANYDGIDSVQVQICDDGIPQACDTSWVILNVHASPQIITTVTQNKCYADSTGAIDITLNGKTPFTYNWSNGSSDKDIDSLVAAEYTVMVTDSFGCVISHTDTIFGPASPLSAISNLQPVLCYADSSGAIDLQTSGGTFPYTYSWTTADTTEDIDSLLAGVYEVTIADSNGCLLVISDTILQPDSALIASIIKNNILCSGDSTGSLTLSVNGGTPVYSYLWSDSSVLDSLTNLPAGTFTVTVTDAYMCSVTLTDSVLEINTAIQPDAVIVSPKCLSGDLGSVTLAVSGAVAPYTYLWSTADTLNAIDSLSTGTYDVTIHDSIGCNLTVSYVITDSSSLAIDNSGNSIFCSGDSVLLSVISYPNVTYQWIKDGFALTADTTNQLMVHDAGEYSIVATSGCGIFTSGPDTINVNALPVVAISPAASITCDSVITITAAGGLNYSWIPSAVCETPNESTTTIHPQSTTTFVVMVTDSNGCVNMDSVLVDVTCDTLFVPSGFSPNGDGVNDYFVISNLTRYPDAMLSIYNRWGDMIYKKEHYDNSWNGFSNAGLSLGKEVPNGTYYFVFEPGNGEPAKAAYVVLRR